jgi:hypothetical protein
VTTIHPTFAPDLPAHHCPLVQRDYALVGIGYTLVSIRSAEFCSMDCNPIHDLGTFAASFAYAGRADEGIFCK